MNHGNVECCASHPGCPVLYPVYPVVGILKHSVQHMLVSLVSHSQSVTVMSMFNCAASVVSACLCVLLLHCDSYLVIGGILIK